MINRLIAIENRYNEIADELANPNVVSDIKKMTEKKFLHSDVR